jgi:hypothetical protein
VVEEAKVMEPESAEGLWSASVSDHPADTLLRFDPLPNIKNPCEVEVNSIKPVSPSYATSRLGIAEAIDYLSNTNFQSTV